MLVLVKYLAKDIIIERELVISNLPGRIDHLTQNLLIYSFNIVSRAQSGIIIFAKTKLSTIILK